MLTPATIGTQVARFEPVALPPMMEVTDPLAEAPPTVGPDEAARLLERQWGLAGELSALKSERDHNVRLTVAGGAGYVLKLQNPGDDAGIVDFQNRALQHIARVDPELPVTRLVPAVSGEPAVPVDLGDGRRTTARVFTLLPGHHTDGPALGHDSAYDWGATAARVGRALQGFFHPRADYEIQWDIRRAPRLRGALGSINDPRHRELVRAVLDRYDSRVAPAIERVRHQVVHGDLGLDNVLVDDTGRVTGIIDFGDMTHTALVCDLAVVLADVLEGRPDALDLAEAMIAGYQSVTPLEAEEAAILGDLVAARLATSLAVTAWRSELHPDSLSSTDRSPTEGPARYLELLAGLGWDGATEAFAELAAASSNGTALPYRTAPTATLLARRRATLGPAVLSYDEPLHLRRGRGVWLTGADGRRYLDAYNNVPVVGHSHPAVAAAVAAQLRLLDTNSRYLHEAAVELGERLLATTGGCFDRVMLVNSGSEANDVAQRIATFATGSRAAAVTAYAYHGVTQATTDLSPESWPTGTAIPDVTLLPPPGAGDPTAGLPDRLGVTFVDPTFTSDGILGPAPAYLSALQEATRAAGGLFLADEVQAGFGRTGAHLWSYAACGARPDLVTLGKPMGNGFPVAAVLGRSEHIDPFIEETDYFSTFGGNQAAAVAGLAVLRVLEDEDLVAHTASVGGKLRRLLDDLATEREAVAAVRSWGLLAGIELRPGGRSAAAVAEACRQRGVLIGVTGPRRDVLKLRPPLVLTNEDAELLVAVLADTL